MASVTQRLVYDPSSPSQGANVGAHLLAGDGTPITETAGALDVNIASGSLTVDFTYDYAEDSAAAGGEVGAYVLAVRQDTLGTDTSADGDFSYFKVNAKGEQYTIDTDGNALLTTIDADTGSIASDTAALVVDLAAIEVEQLAQGVSLDSLVSDSAAMVVDLAAIEVEQLAQGVTLDSLLVDTGVIAGDTTSIDASITALSKSEDAAHVSGDQGIMGLAVRNDAGTALAGTDGDYIPLSTNAAGELRVVTAVDIDDDLADTAIANTATAVSLIPIPVVSSALSGRKWLFLANEGNKSLYYGADGVSVAAGFPLHPGMQAVARIGDSVVVDVIGETGSASEDLRVMELS